MVEALHETGVVEDDMVSIGGVEDVHEEEDEGQVLDHIVEGGMKFDTPAEADAFRDKMAGFLSRESGELVHKTPEEGYPYAYTAERYQYEGGMVDTPDPEPRSGPGAAN